MTKVMHTLRSASAIPGAPVSPEHDSTSGSSEVLGLVLSLQEIGLGVVENSVRDLQGENLALKIALAECEDRIGRCGGGVSSGVGNGDSGVGGGVSGGDGVVGGGDSGDNNFVNGGDSDGARGGSPGP